MLEIQNLTRSFPSGGIFDINLQATTGETIALLGANGAGKTTLLQTILGWQMADAGDISLFEGRRLTTDRARILEQLGYCGSKFLLDPRWTLNQLRQILQQAYTFFNPRLFDQLLQELRLKPDLRLESFSRGEKARAGWLSALSHEPRLCLFDEASSGLDPASRSNLLSLLATRVCTQDRLVLMATHHPDEISRLATRVLFLHQGRLFLDVPTDKLEECFFRGEVPPSAIQTGILPNKEPVYYYPQNPDHRAQRASVNEVATAFCQAGESQ